MSKGLLNWRSTEERGASRAGLLGARARPSGTSKELTERNGNRGCPGHKLSPVQHCCRSPYLCGPLKTEAGTAWSAPSMPLCTLACGLVQVGCEH